MSNTVTCYFCHNDFPDEDTRNADPFNGGDGGSICGACEAKKTAELFSERDWKYEVANDDTLLGYEHWVEHKVEANNG